MGTFKRAQKFSKTSKDLDQKIQSLNEEMVKTGMSASKKDVDMSGELFNWRQEFGEAQEIKEEVDIIIEEVKEKNKKLASVQHSLVETKLTEANEIFADLYGDQVHGVVETYIGRYASEIKDLREDVIVELQKRPKDLKNLEERLDKLDKGYQVLSERVARASNAAREQQLNEETGVTVNQLKQHYQTMIGKLQENLAMGSGGGGEVNLRYLDDVVGVATNPSAYDGKFLKYDHSLGKFVFETVSAGVGSTGGGTGVGTGGIQLTDLSVIVTPAGISSLTYDDLTGIFEFTPPDLVGFATTGDVLGIVTSGQIAGVITAGDLVGFTTEGDLVGFTTAGDLVGFTTEGDLVGLATEGSGIVRRIEVQGDGLEQFGFTDFVTLTNTGVTSIAAGSGIGIDTSTGTVTVSFLGSPDGITSVTGGTGINVNQVGDTVEVINDGLLSLNEGLGISLTPGANSYTVGNTGIVSLSAGPGIALSYIGQGEFEINAVGVATSAFLEGNFVRSLSVGAGLQVNQSQGDVVLTSTGLGTDGGVSSIYVGAGLTINQNSGSVLIGLGASTAGVASIEFIGDNVSASSTIGNVTVDLSNIGVSTSGIAGTYVQTLTAGNGISIDQISGNVTITNTGAGESTTVTEIVAGSGIAIDQGTGVVTVSTTGIGLTGAVNSISVGAGLTINQPDGDVIIGIAQTGDPGGTGLGYSDFSVTNTLPGISSLTYNDTNGNFDYTPPDLSNYLEGGINILDDDGAVGVVTQINFGDNLFVTATVQSGILTVSGPAPGDVIAGISTLETSYFNHLDVTGVSTFSQKVGIGTTNLRARLSFPTASGDFFNNSLISAGNPVLDYGLYVIDSSSNPNPNTRQKYVRQVTSSNYSVSVGATQGFRVSNMDASSIHTASPGGMPESDVAFVVYPDTSTEIRYNYDTKLETTSTGVNVIGLASITSVETGDLTAGGLSTLETVEIEQLAVAGFTTFVTGVGVNTTRTSGDLNLNSYTVNGDPTSFPAIDSGIYKLYSIDSIAQHYVRHLSDFDQTISVGHNHIFAVSNSNSFDLSPTSNTGVANTDIAFKVLPDAETELRYNYEKKLETTATGIAVTNQIVVGSVGTGVTINGGTGDIFAGNSITAGVFYGDGQFLQNVSAGDITGVNTTGRSFFNHVEITGITTVAGTNESFTTLTNSTGVTNHDCTTDHIFYHTTPSGDFSVNLQNLTLSAEHATTISIVINQGATAYMVTSLEVEGSPVGIKWQGNSTPTGTASGLDNVTFSILNDGGTFVVLGQSVSFGGV